MADKQDNTTPTVSGNQADNRLVKIDSGGIGKVGFNFSNGVRLSVIFSAMTYSDNYNGNFDIQRKEGFVESKTVEIMQTDGNPALNRWIHRKYGDYDGGSDPIGYVPVEHLPAILKRAASKLYAVNDLVLKDPEVK